MNKNLYLMFALCATLSSFSLVIGMDTPEGIPFDGLPKALPARVSSSTKADAEFVAEELAVPAGNLDDSYPKPSDAAKVSPAAPIFSVLRASTYVPGMKDHFGRFTPVVDGAVVVVGAAVVAYLVAKQLEKKDTKVEKSALRS